MNNIIISETCQTEITTQLALIANTKKAKAIVGVILKYALKYHSVQFSQKRIAKEAHSTRGTVNGWIKKLSPLLFKKVRRFKNNKEITCAYHLNPIFREKSILREVAKFIPALRRIPNIFFDVFNKFLLLSNNPAVSFIDQIFKEIVHRNKKDIYLFSLTKSSNRKTFHRKDHNEKKIPFSTDKPSSTNTSQHVGSLVSTIMTRFIIT